MNEWFIIRNSGKKGRGCFAVKDIPKGTQIIEYKGRRISKKLSDKQEEKHRLNGELWIFSLNDKEDIDASRAGNEARFINHACFPNCEAVNYDDEEVWIEALHDIKEGEELTYDYGFGEPDEDYPCYCGHEDCRGWIVEPEYKFSKGEKEELERKRNEIYEE